MSNLALSAQIAGICFEQNVRNFYNEKKNESNDKYISLDEMIKTLRQDNIINDEVGKKWDEARQTRNIAIHNPSKLGKSYVFKLIKVTKNE